MGNFAENHNIGQAIATPYVSKPTAIVAAGAGDNTAITGAIIDRYAIDDPLSVHVALQFSATLAAAATLTFKTAVVQDGDDSGLSDAATFSELETSSGSVVATGPGGGGTVTGSKEYDVNLEGAKRYIRINYTPDLSAGATDTAGVHAVAVFGGQRVN